MLPHVRFHFSMIGNACFKLTKISPFDFVPTSVPPRFLCGGEGVQIFSVKKKKKERNL